MKTPAIPGTSHTQTITVDRTLVVSAVSEAFIGFRDMPPVFATAFMVGFMEWACIEAMRPWLEPGEHTVGTHINVSHVAATPVGMKVTATVELVAVEGRKLSFRVSCRDEVDLVGEGTHQRAVIYPEKSMARLAAKGARRLKTADDRLPLTRIQIPLEGNRHMKRLDAKSLPHFLDTAGVSVVLLGFDDAATLKQAEEFALLWASCQEEGLVGIQFGYVDGETNRDAWDMLGVSVAPCLAILRQGVVTRRLEGHHDHQEIAAIMRQPAAFPWRRQRASLSPARTQEQCEHVAA